MPSVYLALLIPFILTFVFYIYKKHEFKWWEFFIPIGTVLIAIVIGKLIVDYSSVRFTEYWGSTVISVVEEEPWNEWVQRTCTETYPCGTDANGNTQYCTRTYDCSYQDDHGPQWYAKTNIGETFDITEREYEKLKQQFGTPKKIIKTRRNHSASSRAAYSRGTKFEGTRVGRTSNVISIKWDNNEKTRQPYASRHSYENRIKASDLSVFNISVVTEELADSLKLFNYPDLRNNNSGMYYPTILGDNISPRIQKRFQQLNGKFGPTNQLRLWVLVFEDKPSTIAQYQENYWVKGNKNELVLCIGVKDDKIQWTHSFSWALSNTLTAEVKQTARNLYTYVLEQNKKNGLPIIPLNENKITKTIKDSLGIDTLPPVIPFKLQNGTTVGLKKSKYPELNDETWLILADYLDKNLNRFKRRSFEEFSYLKVEPSKTAVIVIYIIALIISIITNIWVTNNEINDESDRYNKKYRRRY